MTSKYEKLLSQTPDAARNGLLDRRALLGRGLLLAGWIWGVGVVTQLPTHSNDELGNKNWGLGPSFVVLHLEKGDPWVYGVLVNNIWSVGSREGAPSYNNGLIQPFLNYNLPDGAYLTSSPVLTVDWKANSGNRWTVPLGGGIGKIFHFGRLPVNMQIAAYYPDGRNEILLDVPNYSFSWQTVYYLKKPIAIPKV